MKVYCRYTVIDIVTGYELACGEKYKDFENDKIRYVQVCEWRDFPFFWRRVRELFRTVTIKGRECVIIYWVERDKKHVSNFSYRFQKGYFLRARAYSLVPPICIDYLIDDLGVR